MLNINGPIPVIWQVRYHIRDEQSLQVVPNVLKWIIDYLKVQNCHLEKVKDHVEKLNEQYDIQNLFVCVDVLTFYLAVTHVCHDQTCKDDIQVKSYGQ